MWKFVKSLALPITLATCCAAQSPQTLQLSEAVRLWDVLPKPIEGAAPVAPEALDQPARFVLYRTRLLSSGYNTGLLNIRNYACTYIDELPDTGPGNPSPLDTARSRRTPGWPVRPCATPPKTLYRSGSSASQAGIEHGYQEGAEFGYAILIDNAAPAEPAPPSIQPVSVTHYSTPPATYGALRWYTYPQAMSDPSSLKFRRFRCIGACFYRAQIAVATPSRLTLDISKLSHGQLWINGQPLSTFNSNRTVSIPASMLKSGPNELIVFDMDGDPFATVTAR